MNRNDRFTKPNAEDIFATAASRLQAGDSIPDILASYPPAMHDELLEMLSIVEVTEQMRHAPVPRPSASKRAAAKRQFLATAAQMRLEQQAKLTPPVAAATTSRPTSRHASTRRATRRALNPWDRFMDGLQSFFGSRALRLAPLIAVIALVLLSTSTLVSLAQNAIPGDPIYTLKQTIRTWELALAPASQRDLVRQEQERELAEDVAKAANRADANNAVLQAQDTQIYYGRNGRVLKIGGLRVMDQYQPDANVEVFRPMTIEGDLQPGARVEVTYQIMPGMNGTAEGFALVQGISLVVVEPPNEAEVIEVDIPASELQDAATCTIRQPEGWVRYTVKAGDNLTWLAERGGTTTQHLAEVNCLESDMIVIGSELFVPTDSLNAEIPLLQCGSEKPEGWELYTVQAGDMLYRLAEERGASFTDVLEVNCMEMEDANTIVVGEQIYLPAAE